MDFIVFLLAISFYMIVKATHINKSSRRCSDSKVQ
jgi:hypothetical protein